MATVRPIASFAVIGGAKMIKMAAMTVINTSYFRHERSCPTPSVVTFVTSAGSVETFCSASLRLSYCFALFKRLARAMV